MKMNCVAFAISGQKNSLEAAMRYQKANEILPKELVELIQSYMDGGYVYIPRKEENRKSWRLPVPEKKFRQETERYIRNTGRE